MTFAREGAREGWALRPAVLAAVLGFSGVTPAADLYILGPEGREPAVARLADGVADPVFALVIGLALDDLHGTLEREDVAAAVESAGRASRLPFEKVRRVTRSPEAGAARVTMEFDRPLVVNIPYSILGYHPGEIRAAETVDFWHWSLGDLHFPYPVRGTQEKLAIEDAHILAIDRGHLAIDVDWALDKLFGARLDDTEVVSLLLFRLQGRLVGMATGYNGDKRGRSGSFDFVADEVLFPSSDELKYIGRTLRRRTERLLASRRARTWPVDPGREVPAPPSRETDPALDSAVESSGGKLPPVRAATNPDPIPQATP